MNITVKRIKTGDEHEDQKWFVLEASIEGVPAVTKRASVNVAAIASGDVQLAAIIDKLRADVAEYHARWLTVQNLPETF